MPTAFICDRFNTCHLQEAGNELCRQAAAALHSHLVRRYYARLHHPQRHSGQPCHECTGAIRHPRIHRGLRTPDRPGSTHSRAVCRFRDPIRHRRFRRIISNRRSRHRPDRSGIAVHAAPGAGGHDHRDHHRGQPRDRFGHQAEQHDRQLRPSDRPAGGVDAGVLVGNAPDHPLRVGIGHVSDHRRRRHEQPPGSAATASCCRRSPSAF